MGSLRVIGGMARGRRLRSVPGNTTRPITDRVKESLFNIIGADIKGSALLDLFAGTGSVGIEALSRGAASVRFIDKTPQALHTIRSNLQTTGLGQGGESGRAETYPVDAYGLLERPADMQFDYIYIAPPQYKEMWQRALAALDANPGWMNSAAWVIVQIHPVEYQALKFNNLEEFDQRKYGSTLLVFYGYRLEENA